MSREAEKTLFGLLIDLDEITTLAMEGLPIEAIPSIELQPIYEWAMNYFHQSGRTMPPSVEAFKATEMIGAKDTRSMYEVLLEYDIEMGELPDQHMLWAIEELKATFLKKHVQDWSLQTGRKLTEVPSGDTSEVLAERASELVSLSLSLESRRTRVDLREVGDEMVAEYELRKADQGNFHGMHFGLPEVDEHTYGIHEGELAVVGAYAKVGKSYFLDRVALKEWEIGRKVSLFTLENSIEMTRDRIGCMAVGVDPTLFDQGEISEEQELRVRHWVQKMQASDNPLHIIRPEPSQASVAQIVVKAQLLGTESLIVDQLTFVEAANPKDQRYLQIRQMMHDFKSMISSGHDKMSCLLAHQIRRDGMTRARKNNYHMMDDFAEGSEVERTVDWAFSLFQGQSHRGSKQILFQTLACRRRPTKNWLLNWDISTAEISVFGEEQIDI